ncbi:MAG: His Kinase (Phospho-acceptor) protein [Caulobacter sp.]|nr:His Kinase (Phospho-acceptor) protein [Caulobacter sp.]
MGLIGRDRELARLKSAIHDAGTPVLLITGPSGAGKTALARAAIDGLGGAVLQASGKYAEGEGGAGFLPILSALSTVVEQALDLLYDPQAGLESLSKAVGPGFDLLTRMGFDALGALPDPYARGAEAVGARASAARLVDAVLRVIDWLNGFGATTVLFIDDWQRAPQEAQALAAALVREPRHPFFTLLLAQRDDAAPVAGAVRLAAPELALGPLGPKDRAELLAMALGEAGAAADAWLGDDGGSLPLALLEAAQALTEAGALSQADGVWRVSDAKAAAIDRGDFTASMGRRVQGLEPAVRRFGQGLALWGDRGDPEILALALGVAPAEARQAGQALAGAGIVRGDGAEFAFTHDRHRASLLAGSSGGELDALAAEMAERLVAAPLDLWGRVGREALYLRLQGGLGGAEPGLWRDRFAQAAHAARIVADTRASVAFAEAAWTLRGRQGPGEAKADSLILREAALAAGARRDAAAAAERTGLMIAAARSEMEIAEAYDLAVSAQRLAGDDAGAWAIASECLRRHGIVLPRKATMARLMWESLVWTLSLALWPSREAGGGGLSPLARGTHSAGSLAFERNPMDAMFIGLIGSAKAHRAGDHDPFWLTTDTFLAAALGRFEQAARLGARAVKAAPDVAFGRGLSLYRAAFFGVIWQRSLAEMPPWCDQAYDMALAEGDLVSAGYAIRNSVLLDWRLAPALPPLLQKFSATEEIAERLGDESILAGLRLTTDAIRRIMQHGGLGQPVPTETATPSGTAAIPVIHIELLALAGDWVELARFAESMLPRRAGWSSHPGGVIWRYYENLARLKTGRPVRRGDLGYIKRAARLNPTDHAWRLVVLRAESLRQKGQGQASLAAWSAAIETLRTGGSRLDAGVAAECAAAAARALDDVAAAGRYEAIAREIWRAWGARSKLPEGEAATDPSVLGRLAAAESQAALAQKADRAKMRFLADVSHELRTPMQSIQTLLELAADDPGAVDLPGLRDAFGSLREVVDDLTDLGAQSGGDAVLRLAPIDLAALARTELGLVGPAAAARGLELELSLDAALPGSLVTDGARVRQVLRNLLSNAVKYVEAGRIAVRLASIGGEATITVEDTGPGVTEAQKTLIFEPFDRGGREEPGGLGLGLTISRRIAQRLGGRLDVDNRPEGGARFTFRFPAVVSAEPPAEPVSPLIAPLKVMIVDDVALIRRSFAAVLRRDGHTVVEAATVAQAIAFCREPLDLILLDLGLPDGDGLEVIAALHEHCGDGQAPPVIVLTGSTAPERVEAALGAGAAKVLFKPVAAPELRAAIAESLGQATQPAAREETYEAELSRLAEAAQIEVKDRTRELLADVAAAPEPGLAREAHRLAGLAAQFGMAEAAGLLDALQAGLEAGAVPPELTARLERVLADL